MAATQVGAQETWSPRYLVKTKVATRAKGQQKPPAPRPLHPALKLETEEETAHDKWTAHYMNPHTTTRKTDAAKIIVTDPVCTLCHREFLEGGGGILGVCDGRMVVVEAVDSGLGGRGPGL